MVQRAFTSVLWWSFLSLLLTASSLAQESFEVSVNRNPVRTGEQVQLTFTLKNFNRKIDPPTIDGLKWLFGPSTSNSTSFINGARTSEVSYTYTYQVISKTNVEIPAFNVTASKGKLNSKPFTLKVLPKGQSGQKQGSGGGDLGNVACIIEASKRKVHIGEPVVVSFKIFNRANNLDVREFNIPETPGFWKEQVEMPDPRWEPQIISGKRYNVANVRTLLLFPQQTGDLTIEGFDLVGYMRTSFFDGQNVSASANPIGINVQPLPEPIPREFVGSYGRMRATVKQSERTCKTNEAITFEVIYSGEGNLKFIREPKMDWPGEFEVFDPEVIDRIQIDDSGERGTRTYRYVVIPRAPGDYLLPTPEGEWFNWNTHQYESLAAQQQKLTVERNENDGGGQVNYNSKTDVQVLNQDIQFIHTEWNGPCLPRHSLANRRGYMAGWLSIGPVCWGLALWMRRRKDQDILDPIGLRKRKARQAVRGELRNARKQVHTPEAFFPALGAGLEDYLMAKLGWNASQMQREALSEALAAHVPHLADRWKSLLETMDVARYAPAQAAHPAALLAEAESLVSDTEKSWKA